MKTLINELSTILEDETIPKNVRIKIEIALSSLQDDSIEKSLRANKAIQELDDVSDNPNIPSYIKSQIWLIISRLETL